VCWCPTPTAIGQGFAGVGAGRVYVASVVMGAGSISQRGATMSRHVRTERLKRIVQHGDRLFVQAQPGEVTALIRPDFAFVEDSET